DEAVVVLDPGAQAARRRARAATAGTAALVKSGPRACFVCGSDNRWGLGVTFHTTGAYEVEAEMTFAARHQGHPGWAHGGVLAALLDEALGRAMMAEHPDRLMVTARLEIHYRKPITVGEKVIIRGRLTAAQRHLATCIREAF